MGFCMLEKGGIYCACPGGKKEGMDGSFFGPRIIINFSFPPLFLRVCTGKAERCFLSPAAAPKAFSTI